MAPLEASDKLRTHGGVDDLDLALTACTSTAFRKILQPVNDLINLALCDPKALASKRPWKMDGEARS